MKKLLMSVLCLLAIVMGNGQSIVAFTTDHDKFMKELDPFMTAGKLESNVKTFEEFQKLSKAGKISSGWIDQIITTGNLMLGRQMAPYPYFHNFLDAVIAASNAGKSDAQFQEWLDLTGNIIKNQKKGDNSEFLKFMDFSSAFFKENALNITAAKTWKVETTSYKFNYDDNKPHITFPATILLGYVKGDTVSIKQTEGDYYPLETKWYGKSGKVDWARAGLDPNKVFCTFKNYTINLSNFNYTVDTVTFTHSDYFKQTLKGRLTDKMVSSADSINMTYPRFESYDAGMTIKDIAPNVSYTGGFSLHGSRVLGSSAADEKALLTFYSRDNKTKILTARARALTIKKGVELGADKAEVAIYFGKDSIYHPQLSLIYKVAKREMRLLRGETGLGQAKFTDSYHNDEFTTDAIFWNLDSSILNLKILSGVGKKPGVYESVNYFNKELLRKTQGFASYEPLSVLKKLYEKSGSRDINTVEFARALDPNLKEGEVKSLLYDLVANGFILYNEEIGVITVRDKAINYVLAKAKKIDYDIITIKSAPASSTVNDAIDMSNNNIDLKGVYRVPISDTAFVYFVPKANKISLQKDRNMEFDGTVMAGRMDLIGEKNHFNYAPFTVDLVKVDSMRINVPDSGKVDKDGNPLLKPLKSRVENLKGLIEIDAPINKSGRTRLPQFPRLYSREKSHIFYDDPDIAKGAYTRKNFFFELEPFRIDSLNTFDPDIINWKGTLVSGGIFPDIKDSVHIQRDESLGFKSETPEKGYELYKGKGHYWGKYELNYAGLQGSGRITHSTAEFTTFDAHLYPDSMRATTDTFRIAKTFEGVKTPSVVGVNDMVFWKPFSDSMHISMTKTDPFAMYDDTFTTFKGSLLLTNVGLRGNGTLDWNEATLTSKDIAFRTMDLSADTASLSIKTTGDRVSFKTPNVSAKVDFKTRIGDFKSNLLNIPTEFSYNQYTTAINEFKWFMDEKILDFKAPANSEGAYFNSTRPDQKGLRFLGKRAIYNLVSSVLRIEQVPGIPVADAMAIPDSGVVIIEGEAKMHQLRNSIIVADTINKYHKFENCVIDIYSKEELKAVGDYKYPMKDSAEVINFGDIGTKKDKEGEHRKKADVDHLVAKANIDASRNLLLYPNVKFNGEANILSVNPLINFKGFAKIELKNPKANTSDFFINQDVDPKDMALRYDDKTKSSTDNHLSAGIHINPVPDAAMMYTTLLGPKQASKDITVFKTGGIVAQIAPGEYAFGDSSKIKEKSFNGNVIRYDDKKGIVKADGAFDLGTKFGIIKSIAGGSAYVKLDSGVYKLNLSLAIDANAGDKIEERLEFHMGADNSDQPDLSYESDKQKIAIHGISQPKEDRKMLEEFDKTAAFVKRPKDVDENLVFSDVNFVFDPDDVSLRSVGKIGVAMIGKKIVNKKLDGYIEIQYKGGADVFTIYLATGTKDWVYFEYHAGTLGVLASYDDINKLITALPPDKRKINSGKRFYLYSTASALNKADFIDYMKDKENGVVRKRPEPRFEEPPIEIPGDSTGLPGDSVPLSPEQLQQQRQQQDINQIEQMKGAPGGGSILSGPPPDRKKGGKKGKKGNDAEQQQQNPEENAVPANAPDSKQQEEIRQIEQMKGDGNGGGGGILSGPPPGRNKPAEEPKQDANPPVEAPKQDAVPPTDQPVQQQPPAQEPPKQEVVPTPEPVKQEPPKQEMPVNEPPKQDAVPPANEQPKQDVPPVNEPPKQEAPKTDAVQPPVPDAQQPKIEEPKTEPKQETTPVSEPPKQEPPKTEAVQPPVQEAPKTETPPAQQQAAPPVNEAAKQDAPKTDAVQPPVQNTEPPKQENKPEAIQPVRDTHIQPQIDSTAPGGAQPADAGPKH